MINGYSACIEACKRTRTSVRQMCIGAGKKESTLYSGVARGSSPTTDTLAELMDVVGYAVAVMPREDVPPSALVIGCPDNETRKREQMERKRKKLAQELQALDKELGEVD